MCLMDRQKPFSDKEVHGLFDLGAFGNSGHHHPSCLTACSRANSIKIKGSHDRLTTATVSAEIIVQSLQIFGVRANADGASGCWKTPTIAGGSRSCSCRSESYGVLADYNCGSQGYTQRSYKTCLPSDAGYQSCGSDYVQIGSSWNCGIQVDWKIWSACIGVGLVCEKQCIASAANFNWKTCYTCWAAYIAACTGCGIRKCNTNGSTPLWGGEINYATGSCPDGSSG